jgi:ubiquinone/menaquinone biosynthesis C-methylase UbiE
MPRQGWEGWDEYAPFYDWENARTLGRRDVGFWKRLAAGAAGRVLELGCGTGRVTIPLAKSGVDLVGVDRSQSMLDRAIARTSTTPRAANPESRPSTSSGRPRAKSRGRVPAFVRADIRTLPFRRGRFAIVLAPYGILQSLTRETDLAATLASVARVLQRGGTFGIDLVPDVPNWREYRNKVQLQGKATGGAQLTLVESVRQDPRRRLTTFEQRYLVRRGRQTTTHRFELTFRTLSVPQMTRRLECAGFSVETVLGDYRGRPWDDRADVWIILAKKV